MQAEGNAGPSLARELLTSMGKEELTHEVEDRIKWTTGAPPVLPAVYR